MVGNHLKITKEQFKLHRDAAQRDFELIEHKPKPAKYRNWQEKALWGAKKIGVRTACIW